MVRLGARAALAIVIGLAACSSSTDDSKQTPVLCTTCDPLTAGDGGFGEGGTPVPTVLTVTLDNPSVRVAQKTWIDVPITIARPPGVMEPLNLEVGSLPAGAVTTTLTVTEGQSRASFRLTVGPNTPQGIHTLDVTLRGQVNVASTKLTLEVVGSPGTIDTTFGPDGGSGRVTSMHEVPTHMMTRQPDGHIVLAGALGAEGSRNFAAIRFDDDGNPDALFGDAGKAIYDWGGDEYPYDIVAQPDGRLVTCGFQNSATSQAMLYARWMADGKVDTSFGTAGKVAFAPATYSICYGLMLQSDGKLVGSGGLFNGTDYNFTLTRVLPAGGLDTDFGAAKNGFSQIDTGTHEYAFASVADAQGRLVVTGERYNGAGYDIMSARFAANGTIDTSFGADGKGFINQLSGGSENAFGWHLALQPDGKILIGGAAPAASTRDFALVRTSDTGQLDPTFGTQGKTQVNVGVDRMWRIRLDSKGRIVFVGVADSGAATRGVAGRLLPDGSIDASFGNNGVVLFDFSAGNADYAYGLEIVADDKILVSGYSVEASKFVPWVVRLWP